MVPGRHSLIWQTSKFNTEPEGPPLQIMAKIMAGDGTVPTLTCKILSTFILELPTRWVCQMAIVVPCCAQIDGVVMIYTVWTDTSNECPFLKSWVNNQQSPAHDKKWEDMINTPSKPYPGSAAHFGAFKKGAFLSAKRNPTRDSRFSLYHGSFELKSGLLMISIPVFMNCFISQFSKPSYCSNRNNKHP